VVVATILWGPASVLTEAAADPPTVGVKAVTTGVPPSIATETLIAAEVVAELATVTVQATFAVGTALAQEPSVYGLGHEITGACGAEFATLKVVKADQTFELRVPSLPSART
jgi:hypothetical protein